MCDAFRSLNWRTRRIHSNQGRTAFFRAHSLHILSLSSHYCACLASDESPNKPNIYTPHSHSLFSKHIAHIYHVHTAFPHLHNDLVTMLTSLEANIAKHAPANNTIQNNTKYITSIVATKAAFSSSLARGSSLTSRPCPHRLEIAAGFACFAGLVLPTAI